VALAFQPLRGAVVRLADQLAFGSASAPYEALADLSRRLGDKPDPATLLPTVARAAANAVSAGRAVVSLHVQSGPDLTALWPTTEADDQVESQMTIPIVDHEERLGSMTIEMAAGRRLRPHDQRLLADLADQAAMAFRNARLTADLSAQVQQLSRQTDELNLSRARLISAGDAERRRVERAIAGEVIPHLSPLPDRLRELSRFDSDGPTALRTEHLAPLLASTNTALRSLREITRGVFPAQLARSGLQTALGSLLARPDRTGRLTVDESAAGLRFGSRVEAAAYFCVAEATQAFPDPVSVVLWVDGDQLHLSMSGTESGGLSLSHMRDRVDAAGGSVSATNRDGRTIVDIRAPSDRTLALS
jgi:GAF domain-containing protein